MTDFKVAAAVFAFATTLTLLRGLLEIWGVMQ
jgi:hypothetical protein